MERGKEEVQEGVEGRRFDLRLRPAARGGPTRLTGESFLETKNKI